MSLNRIFGSFDVSGSAPSAEQARMKAIADNIANASTTRTPEGGPYRRQRVVFETVLRECADGTKQTAGVRVAAVRKSDAPPLRVFDPDHPDADATGFVAYPDVSVPSEMIDMIAAARAYEANLEAIKNFKGMVNKALAIAR